MWRVEISGAEWFWGIFDSFVEITSRFSFIAICELVSEFDLVSEFGFWTCESVLDLRLANLIFGPIKIFSNRSKNFSGSVEQSEIFFRVKSDFPEAKKVENFVLGRGLVILFPN